MRLAFGAVIALRAVGAVADEPAPAATRLDTIEVDAPRARSAAAADEADAPGFVTIVDVDRPSARVASVAELVQREAGVRVRSAGGLGTYSAVSIRGSDTAEVAVFLDGVPLNRAAGAAVDLAQLPVDGLERVEIYRGWVPPELGGASVGGAINLVTRKGARAPALRASVGAGSFGTRSATVGYGFGGRALHADASASYRGSRGDFIYYYDNGTLLDTADDRPERRVNNDFDQGAADVSVGGTAGEGGRTRWSFGAHGFLKDQGVAGRASAYFAHPPTARVSTGRLLVDGAIERTGFVGPAVDARLAVHGLFQRTEFDNHAGDLVGSAIREHSESDALEGGFDARLAASTSRDLFSLLLSGSLEHYAPRDLLGARAPAASDRRRLALTAADDIRLAADRVVIAPAVRFDAVENRVADDAFVFAGQAAGQTNGGSWLSPQLGLRFRALPWLQLKGSVARAIRLPSLYELFGDRAFVLPRPGLRPEVSVGGDAGAALDLPRLARGRLALALEGDFFGRQVDDYIALQRTTYAAAYDNVGTERFLGAEVRARARVGAFAALSFDYTFVKTIDDGVFAGGAGKALPGVPAHKLDLRAELASGPFGLYYELAWTSEVYLTAQMDEGTILPARALHALGVHAGPFPRAPLRLDVEVANLADLRVVDQPLAGSAVAGQTRPAPLVDFKDYPLPGRTVFVTLAWQP